MKTTKTKFSVGDIAIMQNCEIKKFNGQEVEIVLCPQDQVTYIDQATLDGPCEVEVPAFHYLIEINGGLWAIPPECLYKPRLSNPNKKTSWSKCAWVPAGYIMD